MPRDLLPELISDILPRLPAKSLLRFRSVSNSLCDEIDSSNFAQIHLNRSIKTRSHRKLIFTNSKDYYASDFDEGLKTALKFNNQFPDQEQYTTSIIGDCRGLILLRVESSAPDYLLWNPTTRKSKKLPPCPGENPSRRGLCCGLGYDSASDDFKVVRIISDHQFVPTSTDYEPHYVWVFNLKTNSWRWTQDLHIHAMLPSCPVGFANGLLYFIYFGELSGNIARKVGCFDLASEVFFTIPNFCSPNDGGLLEGRVDRPVRTSIVVLEGNVCMNRYNVEAGVVELYSPVVDDDEDRGGLPGGNWSKVFTFQRQQTDCTRLFLKPRAYSKDGADVLLQTGKELFWYNVEKKTRHGVNQLLSGVSISQSDRFKCCVVWESLVSLGNDGVFQV